MSESYIAKTDVHKRLKLSMNRRYGLEEFECVFNGHIEHFSDISTLVLDLERFSVVALPFADITGNVDVGQEVHFHFGDAITLAGLTASSSHIEAKSAGFIATRSRFLCARKQLSYGSENACIGRRV